MKKKKNSCREGGPGSQVIARKGTIQVEVQFGGGTPPELQSEVERSVEELWLVAVRRGTIEVKLLI